MRRVNALKHCSEIVGSWVVIIPSVHLVQSADCAIADEVAELIDAHILPPHAGASLGTCLRSLT